MVQDFEVVDNDGYPVHSTLRVTIDTKDLTHKYRTVEKPVGLYDKLRSHCLEKEKAQEEMTAEEDEDDIKPHVWERYLAGLHE
eukprot:2723118-Karenia_brevis.AAC.1